MREGLEPTAFFGVLLLYILFGNCRALMDTDQTVHSSRHFPVREDQFSMNLWTNIILVNKDDGYESFEDEKDKNHISNEQNNENGLNVYTRLGQSTAPPDGNEVSRSPLDITTNRYLQTIENLWGRSSKSRTGS